MHPSCHPLWKSTCKEWFLKQTSNSSTEVEKLVGWWDLHNCWLAPAWGFITCHINKPETVFWSKSTIVKSSVICSQIHPKCYTYSASDVVFILEEGWVRKNTQFFPSLEALRRKFTVAITCNQGQKRNRYTRLLKLGKETYKSNWEVIEASTKKVQPLHWAFMNA